MRAQFKSVAEICLSFVTFFLIWHVLSVFVLQNYFILPPPLEVFIALASLISSGKLLNDGFNSLLRYFSGLALGASIGVALGIFMTLITPLQRYLDPIINLVRPISPIIWIPISVAWFGIRGSPYFIVFIGTFFPVLISTLAGIKGVNKRFVWVALTSGGSRRQAFRHVVLPAAMPSIMAGLRISLGTGWFAVVAAEMVAARSGLGYRILESLAYFNTAEVFAGTITIGFIGFIVDMFFVHMVQNRILFWRRGIEL